MSNLSFRCPHCAHDVAAPAIAVGSGIKCPNCNQDLIVPPVSAAVQFRSGGGRFLSALNAEVGQLFRWSQSRKAPPAKGPAALRQESAPKAKLRSIRQPDGPVAPKLRLQDKPSPHECHPPAAFIRRSQARRGESAGRSTLLRWMLGSLVVLAVGLYFVNLGNPSRASGWQRAEATLARLSASPADAKALRDLNATVESLTASGVSDAGLVGLLSVYGLVSESAGNAQARGRAERRVRQAAPKSPYLALLTPDASAQACLACGGSGKRQVACLRCAGSGKCGFCKGTAIAPGLRRAPGSQRTEHPLKCIACRGTGLCPGCQGGKATGTPCGTCSGQGKVFTREEMRAQIAKAISLARRDTASHLRFAVASDWLSRMQARLRQAGAALRQ